MLFHSDESKPVVFKFNLSKLMCRLQNLKTKLTKVGNIMWKVSHTIEKKMSNWYIKILRTWLLLHVVETRGVDKQSVREKKWASSESQDTNKSVI